MTITLALIAAAISIGSIHTLSPDHWVPFAALGRAEGWSARRTAGITAACGLGHVTVSVALGLLGVFFGRELFETFGHRLDSVSGLLLIGFGVAYGAWGLHRTISVRAHDRAQAHGHAHAHLHRHHQLSAPVAQGFSPAFAALKGCATSDHESACDGCDQIHRPMTAWTLFLLFSVDPCVAVIPLMFASAPLGWARTLAVVAAYELATIGTMVLLVLPARAAVKRVRGAWADRWGDALAGGVVALVGIVVVSLGI